MAFTGGVLLSRGTILGGPLRLESKGEAGEAGEAIHQKGGGEGAAVGLDGAPNSTLFQKRSS